MTADISPRVFLIESSAQHRQSLFETANEPTDDMNLESYFDDFSRRDWQRAEDGTIRVAMIGLRWWTHKMAIPAVERSDFYETFFDRKP